MQKIAMAFLLCISVAGKSFAQNIVRVEHFFNTDPGFGNGTAVALTANSNIENLSFNANVSNLGVGLHFFQVRSLDANGRWSSVSNSAVYKLSMPSYAIFNIVRLEYFIDTDPGFGNGIAVPITSNSNIENLSFNADISGLGAGLHFFQVRSLDANGRWSSVHNSVICKLPVPSTENAKLVRLEYFIDTDPGMGMGTSLQLTSSENISDLTTSIDISNYSPGIHYFYLRSIDENGRFSVTNFRQFEISGILPLTLINYSVALTNNKVKHAWLTADEVNVSHFAIERSLDGISFTEIGRVSAHNKKEPQQYFFNETLSSQLANSIYYRLKMVDKDGKFSYSELKTITPETLKNFVVSPNPATDFINIAGEGIRSIAIHSIAGQTVYNANLNPIWEQHTISFGKLPSGLYLVKMVKTNNEVFVEKLIIK